MESSAPAPSAPAASSPAPSAPSASSAGAAPPNGPVTTKAPDNTVPSLSTRRQYKGKVDKEERVWELSDEEVSVRLQKSEAAEARMQKAADIQKRWAALQQAAKEDPSILFRELLGQDPHEWAQKQVEEKWKLEVMPQHEREKYELQKQLDVYQAREKKQREAEARAQATAESTALERQIEADFQEAFRISQLDYTPDNLEMFGKLVLAAHDNGLELSPSQLAAEAKARLAAQDTKYEERFKGKWTSLKGPDLLTYLGDAMVKEVLKAAVAKHAGTTAAAASVAAPNGIPANTHAKGPSRDQKGKFQTTQSWRDSFKNR